MEHKSLLPKKPSNKRSRRDREPRALWISGGSIVTSLPGQWLEKYNLKEGSLVYSVRFDDDDEFISLVPAEIPDDSQRSHATVKILISADDVSKFRSAKDVCNEKEFVDTGLKQKKTISRSLGHEMEQNGRNKERKILEAESAYNILLRKIVATYLVGFNSIHVLCDKNCPSKTLPDWFLERIKKFIMIEGKLYGARCETPSSECLEINVNVEITQYPVREALDDMCEYTEKTLSLALQLLNNFDPRKFESLQSYENEVDARYFYVVRATKLALMNPLLVKNIKLRNFRELVGCRVIAKPIERIADHSYKIASTLRRLVQENGNLGPDARSAAIKLGNQASRNFDMMTRSLYMKGGFFHALNRSSYVQKGFFDEANRLIEETSRVIAEEESIFGELNRKQEDKERKTGRKETALEIWSERIILEGLRRIADYTITVGQIILNICVDSRLEEDKSETGKVYLLKPPA